MTWQLAILVGFTAGLWFGIWARDRIWRGKGDHEYMNRMASGGNLYIVKREEVSTGEKVK